MRQPVEEIRLKRLYELLDIFESKKDADTAAALRWAIFQLTYVCKQHKKC